MPPDALRHGGLCQAAEQLGLRLETQQVQQLLGHIELLEKWSKTFNLTAIRDPAEMVTQHLIDSLAIVPALCRYRSHPLRTILDVGSGAGFPGLVIAVALPESSVVCIDSVGKKVGFIRQVVAELRIENASAVHARVESMPPANANVVTSRAFASLHDFVTLTRKHLSSSGVWLAMKGKRPDFEIAQLPADVEVFHVEQLKVPGLVSERCLIWMRPTAQV